MSGSESQAAPLQDVLVANQTDLSSFPNNNATLSDSDAPPLEDWWRERVQVAPDFERVSAELTWMWQLHILGVASLFLVLCVVTFFTILGLRAQLSSRRHLSSLNLFVCLLSASRCLILFIDPYASTRVMPRVMFAILWDLAFPCLLSAFALLQLAFLQMTRVKLGSSKISNETCVTLVVTSHFCLVIASDILWSLQNSLRMLWLVTQMSSALWGILLCCSFVWGRVRLRRSAAREECCWVEGESLRAPVLLGPVSRQQSVASSSNGTTRSVSTKGSYTPKIRITDENERTFIYAASDASQHPNDVACVVHSESVVGTSGGQRDGKSQWARKSSKVIGSQKDGAADISQCYPLMGEKVVEEEESGGGGVGGRPISVISEDIISRSRPPSIISKKSANCAIRVAEGDICRFPATKYKEGESRLDKLIRKMTLTAAMGILVCLFQIYGVLGPHGLSASRGKPAIIPWFCYQTIYRISEFVMGCVMASISRQSFHMNCYPPFSVGAKYRESLFS